jgi:hypothetical protein
MNIKLLQLSLIVLTISCNQSETKQPKQNGNENSPVQTTNQTERASEKHLNIKHTLDLLQGKWQHIDDKSNYIVFEGNYRKETEDGMTGWNEEVFSLSDKCLNESDKDNGVEKKEAKFISCIKSNLCWYIIGVDKENLKLSYMGRGNTLAYKRVK